METAEHFIHMEYYNWENDIRGNQIKEVLCRKVKEGVMVRILYDAYASRKIKHNIVKELKAVGAEIYPVIKIKFKKFANTSIDISDGLLTDLDKMINSQKFFYKL